MHEEQSCPTKQQTFRRTRQRPRQGRMCVSVYSNHNHGFLLLPARPQATIVHQATAPIPCHKSSPQPHPTSPLARHKSLPQSRPTSPHQCPTSAPSQIFSPSSFPSSSPATPTRLGSTRTSGKNNRTVFVAAMASARATKRGHRQGRREAREEF